MPYIISSGESSEGIVLENDTMTVLDSGVAMTTTVNSEGRLYVSSGGTANSTTVNKMGEMYVSSSGLADETTLNNGGRIYVSGGGLANRTVVYEGGILHVSSGGMAGSTMLNDGGSLQVSSGGTASGTIIGEWGMMNVYLEGLADGNADVFFVNAVGTWEKGFAAQLVGSADDTWGGTGERVVLAGRNKLTDIFDGSSTDANVLLMTDDDNGDALFVDDIYSASPGELGLSQSRIARIDEIRAGAGDDIVDMTSNQFDYMGDGLVIRGGDGNDTIWANKADNWALRRRRERSHRWRVGGRCHRRRQRK